MAHHNVRDYQSQASHCATYGSMMPGLPLLHIDSFEMSASEEEILQMAWSPALPINTAPHGYHYPHYIPSHLRRDYQGNVDHYGNGDLVVTFGDDTFDDASTLASNDEMVAPPQAPLGMPYVRPVEGPGSAGTSGFEEGEVTDAPALLEGHTERQIGLQELNFKVRCTGRDWRE